MARHAGATAVKVAFDRMAGGVRVAVEDNGAGFDANALPQGISGGLGLVGMRERLELLGGQLTVDSAVGRGTTLIATLPLEEPE
ncbi:MAG: ATP-binding protein [Anaerolineae bacterium]